MIAVKEAAQFAKKFAADVLGQHDSQLEELELGNAEGRPAWLITLSFPRNPAHLNKFQQYSLLDALQYKRFVIDAETGDLIAIRLRELATP